MGESAKQKSKKTSNSFEFTSFWADGNNKVIADLIDFTKTFLAKHTILNVLTKYCVFTTEEILMVMRPYQIAATERILNRIEISTNYKRPERLTQAAIFGIPQEAENADFFQDRTACIRTSLCGQGSVCG